MASFTATSTSLPRQLAIQVNNPVQCFSNGSRSNLSFTCSPLRTRLSVSCAAKAETVDKVCVVVKKQLGLKETDKVVAETKFVDLGADSLDTVEIVMGLEEEFGIEMVEEKAQTVTTVEKAAELIEELLAEKA